MNLSIKYKVAVPIVMLAIMLIFIGWLAICAQQRIVNINTKLTERFHEIEEVHGIDVAAGKLLQLHLGFINTRNQVYKEATQSELSRMDELVKELARMASTNSKERSLLQALLPHMREINILSGNIFASIPADYQDSVRLLNDMATHHLAPMSALLLEWHTDEVGEVDELNRQSEIQLHEFLQSLILLLVISIFLLVFAAWLNNTVLIKPLLAISRSTAGLAAGDLKQKIHIYSNDEIGSMACSINAMAESLDKLYAELRTIANTDQLSGMLNRHSLESVMAYELSRLKRAATSMAVVLLDIDHFKRINDTYGHTVGDQVIRMVAGICARTLRQSDYSFRYGGEEFLLLLGATGVEHPQMAIDRLRDEIVRASLSVDGKEIRVTASFGIACYPSDGEDQASLIQCADEALYAAKQNGRNCSVAYHTLKRPKLDNREMPSDCDSEAAPPL
ncbi:GGDEF domain-containing protein [Sulfurirhabdus autotrophica]|uniref:diguanylate cyclase n=1 Tax=Sulfurirhabdus autotrophica TaxID=1706046 RepID=A0A4V2W0Q5_9PROT|nr:GGDEF domain-containing protein [Sulfurirhabdus autotrophica]TCV79182.1 diguanylate cyclase (GGDEF)-like protein [Sulfurirhabdus autotrophica]